MKLLKPFSSFKLVLNPEVTVTEAWALVLRDPGYWLIIIINIVILSYLLYRKLLWLIVII